MENIKGLIVSDIDGTLLTCENSDISQEAFDVINQLHSEGYGFCLASGRQYHSMRKLFEPIADKIYYICENGAVLFGIGNEQDAKVWSGTAMNSDDYMELAEEIMNIPGCDVIISGRSTYYLCNAKGVLMDQLLFSGAHIENIEFLDDIEEDVYKITLFHYEGKATAFFEEFAKRWSHKFEVAVSGNCCLDFTVDNKGMGLRKMCNFLGIDIKDTIAFGDNWNDVAMLEEAGLGYIMDSADSELLKMFPNHCKSVPETLIDYLNKN